MEIAVLLPTLNEAESINDVISRVRSVDSHYKIYIVDGGSTDGTIEIARKAGVRIMAFQKKGKGSAIRKTFKEITEDIAVLLDSDTSYAPEEIPKLVNELKNCDVVVGSRFEGDIKKGSMKAINKVGNIALTMIANILYNKKTTDVCSGFWAFRKKTYKMMEINAKHFELEANFYIECAKKELVLHEVPITYYTRRGQTKLSVLHGFEIGLYLLFRKFSFPTPRI
jgi:dolichol-phosphate mannosyltransferase